ncbi:CGNR zinc finger domain-containing protein [Embleya sp. NPDC059267]|uniref:CGNR zinc finger domain-containing protein n=1 Tax=Embleya sp. NPDC059267 TaxID=3346798 RepID=UPI0036CF30CD
MDQSRNRTRRFCANACASRTTVAAHRARAAKNRWVVSGGSVRFGSADAPGRTGVTRPRRSSRSCRRSRPRRGRGPSG